MNLPLISVIIPAYNCEDFINDAIKSVLNQTYTNLEILIADDASTDRTKEIIDSIIDIRIKTFHNNKNLGYLKTANKLFTLATGDYLVFQDGDDLSDPTRFEKQLEVFKSNLKLGVCGCGVYRIDSKNNRYKTISFTANINASLKEQKFDFVAGTFLFKKEVYETIGGYHEYFDRIGFEHFYWCILAAQHFEIINLPAPLYYYRSTPGSYSTSIDSRIVSFSYQSLLYLLNQRNETGKDYLETGQYCLLKSDVYLKLCSIELDKKNYVKAFKYCCKSILFDPLSFYKVRTLFYILKKCR